MDDAHIFLGMKIKRDRNASKLWVSQREYVEKVLRWFNIVGLSAETPIRCDLNFTKELDSDVETTSYCIVV